MGLIRSVWKIGITLLLQAEDLCLQIILYEAFNQIDLLYASFPAVRLSVFYTPELLPSWVAGLFQFLYPGHPRQHDGMANRFADLECNGPGDSLSLNETIRQYPA